MEGGVEGEGEKVVVLAYDGIKYRSRMEGGKT